MTIILSVSAVTAAYAAEPIKPAQRVNGGPLMDSAIKEQTEQARPVDDLHEWPPANSVRTPALAFYLFAERQSLPGPQTSRQQAEAAYLDAMAMALPELADVDCGETGLSGSDGNTPLAGGDPTAIHAAPVGQSRNDTVQHRLADLVFLPRV